MLQNMDLFPITTTTITITIARTRTKITMTITIIMIILTIRKFSNIWILSQISPDFYQPDNHTHTVFANQK